MDDFSTPLSISSAQTGFTNQTDIFVQTAERSTSAQFNTLSDDFMFYVIHGCAITSLFISSMASICDITTFFVSAQSCNIWKRRLSERLVLYLAGMDLITK